MEKFRCHPSAAPQMELSEVGGLHTSRVVEASKISDKNQDFLRVHWGTVGLSWPA